MTCVNEYNTSYCSDSLLFVCCICIYIYIICIYYLVHIVPLDKISVTAVLVVLLLYVHSKQLWSCRDGQLT